METVADGLIDLCPVEAIKVAKFYFEIANDVWFVYHDRSVIRASFKENVLVEVVATKISAEKYEEFLETVVSVLGPDTIESKLAQLRSKEKLQ